MHDEGVHITLLPKPKGSAGANGHVLNRVMGQCCKLGKEDIKEARIPHGGGRGQSQICRFCIHFAREAAR